MKTKKCLYCKQEFKPKRKKQVFCCLRHSHLYHSMEKSNEYLKEYGELGIKNYDGRSEEDKRKESEDK